MRSWINGAGSWLGRIGRTEPLSEDERRLALRVTAIVAIPLATIVVVALGIAFLAYRDVTNDRIVDNQEAIERLDVLTVELTRERRDREAAISRAVYDVCLANERQDAILVEQLRGAKRRALLAPPSALRREIIEDLEQGIDALEPPGELECRIPRG